MPGSGDHLLSGVYQALFQRPAAGSVQRRIVRRAGCALPVLSPGGPGAVCFFSGRYPLSAALSGRNRYFSPAFAPAVAAGKQPDHPAQGARFSSASSRACRKAAQRYWRPCRRNLSGTFQRSPTCKGMWWHPSFGKINFRRRDHLKGGERDSRFSDSDLQTILTASLLTESKFSGEASLASGAAELASDGGSLQRTVAASLFAESMVAAGGTSSGGGGAPAPGVQDRRCEVSSALFAEYVLSVYEVPAQKKPSLMKIRFKIAAKKWRADCRDGSTGIPRMYQTLTGLGVKRLYIVLKRRAAR